MMYNDHRSCLSKEDKAFIIKMSAVAILSALGSEIIKFGMEGLRSLIKKKDASPVPNDKTDPANNTEAPSNKGGDAAK